MSYSYHPCCIAEEQCFGDEDKLKEFACDRLKRELDSMAYELSGAFPAAMPTRHHVLKRLIFKERGGWNPGQLLPGRKL